ncbi:hypothetical protein MRX96_016231 [Rhipicephalus microplus]
MRAAWLTLAFYATAAGSLSISRKELFREIIRQLSPKHHKNAIGHGPVLYDYEDYFDAPDYEEPLCVAELVLAEDRRATCRPRNQLVPLPPGPPELLRFPRLVELKRCEGACDHAGRQCWPTVKNSVNIKVVRVNVTGGQDTGSVPNQVYKALECACLCPDLQKQHQCEAMDRTWDPEQCTCDCQGGGQDCSTGYHFSKQECRCIPVEEHIF